jgi:hypothetical protein
MGYLGTKPANSPLTSELIPDGLINTSELADNSITTAKIVAGAVVPADLSTGSPIWDTSGNLSFNSGYGSAATAYGCRAWVNFNGTGTVAIRASGNVTSITDNGTGVYIINFTTAMPDANYAVAGFCNWVDDSNANGLVTARANSTKSTTALQVFTTNSTQAWAGAGAVDLSQISVSIFR